MRERFSLDIVDTDALMVLIHGAYGSGKTHLQGDFLRWAQERAKDKGKVAFVNMAGEDGFKSIAGMGLGNVGIQCNTIPEYDSIIAELAGEKLMGVAFDSLPAFYRLMLLHIVGEVRYPDPKKDGERAKMLWGQLTMQTIGRVTASRRCAPYVLWVAPYDKSEDPVTGMGSSITPDLPGKLARGCAGSFDFVGYLEANTISASSVQRRVRFEPGTNILTRQRIPRAIVNPVVIPENGGGWEAIFQAISENMVGSAGVPPTVPVPLKTDVPAKQGAFLTFNQKGK